MFLTQQRFVAGEEFLASLARYLAQACRMDYAFIGRLKEDGQTIQTVGLYAKGKIEPNIEYALQNSPCHNVVGQTLRCYKENVQQLFPDDPLLGRMDAQSYIGMPLWDAGRKPLGLIVVMDTKAIADPQLPQSLLQLVAIRAAGELERRQSQQRIEQARAEAQRQADELNAMFDTLAEPAILYDAQGKVIKVNAAAVEAFGFDPAALSTEEYGQLPEKLNIRRPDSTPVPLSELPSRRALRGEFVRNQEIIFTNAKGRELIVENSSMPLVFGGKIVGAVATWHDITDRKHAENALRHSELRFRTLAEAIPAIIWTAEPDGTVDYYNKRWYEYSGLPANASEAQWEQIFHPDDRQATVEVWTTAIRDERPYNIEHRLRRADGQYRWHLSRGLPLRDSGGHIVKWFGMAMDIDDQKRTLDELERLKEELESKNDELESLIGVASHDLRSPLVNIKGFSGELSKDMQAVQEMLAGLTLPEETHKKLEAIFSKNVPEAVGFIRNSAESINQMLKSLMQVARAGITPLNVRDIDINAVFAKIADNFKFKLGETGVELAVEPLPGCRGDADQLAQVFSNLIDNAIKYREPARQGLIRVYASAEKNKIVYCVEDNGKGISPEHHSKVFEVFCRLDPEGAKGEGLGLTIAKRMVERQGGKIWVDAELGKGSKFFVMLPR